MSKITNDGLTRSDLAQDVL